MLMPYVMEADELVNELRGLWFSCDALLGHKQALKEEWTDEELIIYNAQQIAEKRLKAMNRTVLAGD